MCLSVTQQILQCVHSSSKKTRATHKELSQATGDEWTDLNYTTVMQTLVIDVEDVALRVVDSWMQRPCCWPRMQATSRKMQELSLETENNYHQRWVSSVLWHDWYPSFLPLVDADDGKRTTSKLSSQKLNLKPRNSSRTASDRACVGGSFRLRQQSVANAQ